LFAAEKQSDSRPEEEKEEELEDEDDLLSLGKSASAKLVDQGPSIFDLSKDEDDDIADLFIPAGAIQKKQVAMETENNSELLK
jgi:competence protein ComGC